MFSNILLFFSKCAFIIPPLDLTFKGPFKFLNETAIDAAIAPVPQL